MSAFWNNLEGTNPFRLIDTALLGALQNVYFAMGMDADQVVQMVKESIWKMDYEFVEAEGGHAEWWARLEGDWDARL